MNKIKIVFISNTFVWSCAICWKKLRNHAISPWLTHFLLLTGFGDFPQGSETVSAGFRRIFHRVHGRLAFPPSYMSSFGTYNAFVTFLRFESMILLDGIPSKFPWDSVKFRWQNSVKNPKEFRELWNYYCPQHKLTKWFIEFCKIMSEFF